MRRLRYWIRDLFGFSRTETNGFLVLILLLLALILALPLYRHLNVPSEEDFDRIQNARLDSLMANWEFAPTTKKRAAEKAIKMAYFNPNTADKATLAQLGLRPYLAQRIVNYRAKGGRFNKAEDLLKIYGMDSVWYAHARPFIKLPVKRSSLPKKTFSRPRRRPVDKARFDLNRADSVQLTSLFGIGPVFARRILLYRNLLGGFLTTDQLNEVYGLEEETVAAIADRVFVAPDFVPRQIDLNATAKQLARHPYIDYKLARTISAYRFQHGDFSATADLTKVASMDSATLNKIRPYLNVAP